MRPEDIRELREAEPFVPFRICLTDGKSYDVPHRDFVMIARNVIDIGVARTTGEGIYVKSRAFPHSILCGSKTCKPLERRPQRGAIELQSPSS